MAFRGATGNTYVSQTTLPLSVVTVGIQAGDLVLLLCTQEGGTASPTCQDTADGFAQLVTQAIGGTLSSQTILWKIAAAADTSYTITPNGICDATIQCRAYSGRSSSTPSNIATVASTTSTIGPTGSISLTGITAATGDDVVVFLMMQEGTGGPNTFTFSTPTGFGNARTDQLLVAPGFTPGILGCDLTNASAGSTGSLTVNTTATLDTNDTWGSYVFALSQGSASTALMGQACL